MSRPKLEVSEDLRDELRALHPQVKRRIRAGLDAIVDDPLVGKPLRDELAGLRSHPCGRFRIVYGYDSGDPTVRILAVGPRRSIYATVIGLLAED